MLNTWMREAMPDPAMNERIIVALDYPDVQQAKDLVCLLGPRVRFYKIGLELFMHGEGHALLRWLRAQGCKVFVDLKFFDVPNTIAAAVAAVADSGATFITVHGNDAMLSAAVKNKGERLKVLAVIALTSWDQDDLRQLGIQCSCEELVLSRAQRAAALGCNGVVASGLELKPLRRHVKPELLIVTPGIRPSPQPSADDQKRIVSPEQAFRNGADYIVVGRPISRAKDPIKVIAAMQDDIKKGLALSSLC